VHLPAVIGKGQALLAGTALASTRAPS
jgi:hypothetical protein